MKRQLLFSVLVPILLSAVAPASAAVRIKDVARVRTGPENQLVGYGLVVGLDGTGDKGKTVFTPQSIANMLERMGLSVAPDKLKVKNVAAVMVTARGSSFVRKGSRLDVTVSSIGDATSLRGGTLLLTPLKAIDGRVYATAEGTVSAESFSDESRENSLTVGRVAGGALLVTEPPVASWIREENGKRYFYMALGQPDFTTARRIADTINEELAAAAYSRIAFAEDPGLVRVDIVDNNVNVVDFISRVENIEVEPDSVARVVINERTGTVVMGSDVMISPVAISHGSLSLKVGRQGGAAAGGKTMAMLDGSSVDDVVQALNALGVTPRDIIDIFQAIRKSGAMQAELVVM